MPTSITSVFKSGSNFFTIPASCIRKPLDRISSMEVISPAATLFPRIVFGIHGASSRGFLGGLLPVLRPANLPRGAVAVSYTHLTLPTTPYV